MIKEWKLTAPRWQFQLTTMTLSSAFPLKKLTARQGHQGPLLRLQGPRPPFLAQEGWQRRWRTEEVFNVASRKRKRRRKYAGARWKYSLYLKPINFENIFATLFKTKPCVSWSLLDWDPDSDEGNIRDAITHQYCSFLTLFKWGPGGGSKVMGTLVLVQLCTFIYRTRWRWKRKSATNYHETITWF